MARFYAEASAVLNLSRVDLWVETFGLTLLEAMWFGVPVIVPPVGGPAELVSDGVQGFLVDSRDGPLLRERLLRLADDEALCRAMSEAGRRRAGEFSNQKFGTAIRNVVASVRSSSMIPRFLTYAVKDLAYRFGVEVRRAHPLPKSGRVPSFHDPFHEQKRMLADVAKPGHLRRGSPRGADHPPVQGALSTGDGLLLRAVRRVLPEAAGGHRNRPGRPPGEQGAGPTPGELKFRVNQSTATNSLLATDPRARETWNGMDVTDTVAETLVQVDTLDHFLEANESIGHIDVLKLDAQGGEMDILLGAEKSIGQGRVRILYTEIIVMPTYTGQRSLDEYLAFLRGHGFALHNLYNPLFSNSGQLNQLDALFVRPDLVHVD